MDIVCPPIEIFGHFTPEAIDKSAASLLETTSLQYGCFETATWQTRADPPQLFSFGNVEFDVA
jgi:hypothetical protein